MMQSPVKDLATGKEKIYVYLDPNQIVDKQNYDHEWRDLYLYMPGVLVERGEDEVKLRMPISGDIVRVKSEGLLMMEAQDKEGVPDILSLDNFSEPSLVHTIRLRFERVRCREASLLFPLFRPMPPAAPPPPKGQAKFSLPPAAPDARTSHCARAL
jgi:hypothetical protein